MKSLTAREISEIAFQSVADRLKIRPEMLKGIIDGRRRLGLPDYSIEIEMAEAAVRTALKRVAEKNCPQQQLPMPQIGQLGEAAGCNYRRLYRGMNESHPEKTVWVNRRCLELVGEMEGGYEHRQALIDWSCLPSDQIEEILYGESNAV